MSCCGGGCGSSECPSASPRPKVMCCGMTGSVCIRLPSCPCCLPMCPPAQAPQCPPSLCSPPPRCAANGGGNCPSSCGSSCGGRAPCCPQPAPCRPKVILTKCPKKCCPRPRQNATDQCPDQITWPAPPKIDTCCSTSCPPRSIDICYSKVCPSPPRCCPPNFPCSAKTSLGGCCSGRRGF